jgi:hypothetical protein
MKQYEDNVQSNYVLDNVVLPHFGWATLRIGLVVIQASLPSDWQPASP